MRREGGRGGAWLFECANRLSVRFAAGEGGLALLVGQVCTDCSTLLRGKEEGEHEKEARRDDRMDEDRENMWEVQVLYG